MSRYTQRCSGPCRQVRGNTAFRVFPAGGRHSVCKWCEERDRERVNGLRANVRTIASLSRIERDLSKRLKTIRSDLRRLETETALMLAESQPALSPPDPNQLPLLPARRSA